MAGKGIPGSADFGYGGWIHLEGSHIEQAFQVASSLQFDWLAVEVNWAELYPSEDSTPDWSSIDRLFNFASKHQISVMASLTDAPAWASTPSGPDAGQALVLINTLLNRYGDTLVALELFPAANTTAGWGAPPDPVIYTQFFTVIHDSIRQQQSQLLLIAAGLKPLDVPTENDLEDLVFLQGLYNAGINGSMQILSIQLTEITGDPLEAPGIQEHRVLRHYEEVRHVMTANQDENGLIWVTRLSSPSGTINPVDLKYSTPDAQSGWLERAFEQLRAQLYIGVAFIQSLNPSQGQIAAGQPATLVLDEINYHPFYSILRNLIAQNTPGVLLVERGRIKGEALVKIKP